MGRLGFLFLAFCLVGCGPRNPHVLIETEQGDIRVEVFAQAAPVTAANFLRYVDEGRFAGAFFYRVVTMANQPKAVVSSLGAGPYNSVVLTRYRVTYVRSDGRNTPGVDVPFPFDGAANVQILIGQSTSFDITVVRQSAKLEPPLANMAFNGGEVVLSTIAEIDFFGTDVAGKAITVRGYLNITFGDF